MKLRDQPQLRDSVHAGENVTGEKPEDVVVPQEDSAVYLRLAKPRFLVAGGEFLDGDLVPLEHAHVDLSEPPTPDVLPNLDAPCHRALSQQRRARPASGRTRHVLQVNCVQTVRGIDWRWLTLVVTSPQSLDSPLPPPQQAEESGRGHDDEDDDESRDDWYGDGDFSIQRIP